MKKDWTKERYLWTSLNNTWGVWTNPVKSGQEAIDYIHNESKGTVTEYDNLQEWAKTIKNSDYPDPTTKKLFED